MPLTDDERRLLRDFQVTGFVLISEDRRPDIVHKLLAERFLKWHWNGGVPLYEVTEAGRAALATT